MVISSTEKHRSRWRTHARSMEVSHAVSSACESVQVWCLDLPAEATDIGPAKVISNDD